MILFTLKIEKFKNFRKSNEKDQYFLFSITLRYKNCLDSSKFELFAIF